MLSKDKGSACGNLSGRLSNFAWTELVLSNAFHSRPLHWDNSVASTKFGEAHFAFQDKSSGTAEKTKDRHRKCLLLPCFCVQNVFTRRCRL
jgi:hypothetical protein